MMLEGVITKAIQISDEKVNRKQFLAEQFVSKVNNLEEVLDKGPIAIGVAEKILLNCQRN